MTSTPTRPVDNVVIATNCPSQETEVTSTPTRPVDNVVITMKVFQSCEFGCKGRSNIEQLTR